MTGFVMPLNVGTAIAQNRRALKLFRELSESDKKRVVEKAAKMKTTDELQKFVCRLADGDMS